jgi:hypothetical protein
MISTPPVSGEPGQAPFPVPRSSSRAAYDSKGQLGRIRTRHSKGDLVLSIRHRPHWGREMGKAMTSHRQHGVNTLIQHPGRTSRTLISGVGLRVEQERGGRNWFYSAPTNRQNDERDTIFSVWEAGCVLELGSNTRVVSFLLIDSWGQYFAGAEDNFDGVDTRSSPSSRWHRLELFPTVPDEPPWIRNADAALTFAVEIAFEDELVWPFVRDEGVAKSVTFHHFTIGMD